MTRKLLLLPLLLAFLLPAIASAAPRRYVLKHPRREHCRAHYTKKIESLEEHKHHRTIKRRETVCVYVAPKKKIVAPATVRAPSRTVRLHAHLDPSFVRDPTNPFKVTYSYSASATSESIGDALSSEPALLPEGFLSLYNNGRLACAINVGGSTTGGECPVTYTTLGSQTIVTTYTSGSTSATETNTENVEPFATTTTGTISYEPLATPEEIGGYKSWCPGICYRIGTLHVTGTTTGPYGELAAPQEGPCEGLEGCLSGTTVYADQEQTGPPTYEPFIAGVTTAAGDVLPGGTTWGGSPWYSPNQFAGGNVFVRLTGGAGAGYAPSEARLSVTLTVTAPL